MNHLIQEANSFSKIDWACAVTLNPFVGFGKCLATDLSIIFVWKYAWWDKAENEVGGKEIHLFRFNGIKLIKMHSDGKLIYLAINIY